MLARLPASLLLTFILAAGAIQVLWMLAPAGHGGPERPEAVEPTNPPTGREGAAAVGVEPVTSVSGRVLMPDGEPPRTGRVALWAPDGEDWPIGAPSADLQDGWFRIEAEPETAYDLVVLDLIHQHGEHDPIDVIRYRRRIRPGENGVEIRLAGPLLDLRVEGPGGRPVRAGTVIVDPVGNFGFSSRERGVVDGRVRFLVPGGLRRIVVTVYDAVDADGGPLGRFTSGPYAIGDEPVRVRVPAGRNLRGRVVGPDGEAVEGASLQVVHFPKLFNFSGGWRLSEDPCLCDWCGTDEKGWFSIPGVALEPVRLVILVPGAWLRPAERIVAAGENDLTIVLREGVYPEVRVVDPDGNSASARVDVYREDDPLPPFHLRRGRWVRKGVAAPGPLDPNLRYRLSVSPSKFNARPLEEAYIEDWTPAVTTVRLKWAKPPAVPEPEPKPDPEPEPEPAGVLAVRLDDPRTDGASRADALLVPEDGGPARPLTLWLHRDPLRIRGVDPEKTYTLRVVGVADGFVAEARGLRPGPEVHELTPRPGATIVGRIELPEGTTLVQMSARQGELRSWAFGDAVVLPDGSFEIPGLLPGAWDVEFEARVGETRYVKTLRLVTGGPPVVVRLERLESD